MIAAPPHSLKVKIDSFLIALLIAAVPVNLLSDLGQASTVFYVLAVVALSICFSRVGGLRATLETLSPYRGLAVALFFSLLVITIAALRSDKRLDTEIERALRLCFGTLIILGACLSLRPQWLRQASWGLVATTWVATAYTLWFSWPTTWPKFRRPLEVPQYNAVSYGDLLLLMAVLGTFSLGWRLTRYRKTEIAFKVLTLIVGLVGFMLTQTRGGWLAVPFFIITGLVLIGGKASPRKLIAPALIALLIAAAVFSSSSVMRQRFTDTFTQTIECLERPLTISSECGRIQLWRISWLMFKADPVFGNGATQDFGPKLDEYWRQGLVSDFMHSEGFGESHNDMLFSMASHGVLGLLALLLAHFVPVWLFAKRLASSSPEPARVAAAMGLVLCLGLFAFGWTELILRNMRTLSFYALMLAWLLALSDARFLARHETRVSG